MKDIGDSLPFTFLYKEGKEPTINPTNKVTTIKGQCSSPHFKGKTKAINPTTAPRRTGNITFIESLKCLNI